MVKSGSSREFRISSEIKSDKPIENTGFEVYRSLSEMRKNESGLYNEGLFPYTLIY